MDTPKRRGKPYALLITLALLVGLGTLEVSARVADSRAGRDASFYLPPQLKRRIFEPHPYLGYALRPGAELGGPFSYKINSLGFRGPERAVEKPPGVYRILCLGGSTTFSTGASRNATAYPQQLEAALNQIAPAGRTYEVWNCGTSGYTTADSLINLQLRLLRFDPDAVVVYHAGNDARAIQARGFRPDYSHLRRAWVNTELGAMERFLLGNVRSYAWLTRGRDSTAGGSTLGAFIYHPDVDRPGDPVGVEALEEGLGVYARNMASIAAVARANGIQPVFVTFATCRNRTDGKDMEYFATVGRINERLRALAPSIEVPLLDVAPVLSDRPPMFTDWMHCNDRGLMERAVAIAQAARGQGLFGL